MCAMSSTRSRPSRTRSRSIAARVADVYGSALMLAKSTPPPATWRGTSLEPLTAAGWVDRLFPTVADELQDIFDEQNFLGLPVIEAETAVTP